MALEQATFGAGCFWEAESRFRAVPGVIDARVGHSTGTDGTTAAARIEVVQVDYDPAQVSFADLVDIFWTSHNPRSRDRQGNDSGEGVRSAIFAHGPGQAATAEAARARLDATGQGPIVTQIIAYQGIEIADEHHQRYLEKNGLATCSI